MSRANHPCRSRIVLVAAMLVAALSPLASAVEPPPPAVPVPAKIEIAPGHFKATWESLKTYKCPSWFRDAKLGIWAIQGPQSVPEYGDWYARHMYIEGHRQYQFHVKTFGHPSKFGYKDLAASWKNAKLDTDRLMGLYKKAGVKYFVVLANHHDNWDNWNSKYHNWNSVNVGPKKDIVGLWAKAARKHGLRFGATEHLARCYSWFNTNKGADKKGPLRGVPYDGADPRFADLYLPPHDDTRAAYPVNPPDWWVREWFYRIRDLVDSYKPDLLYTDGSVPYGQTGRALIAHFYNANTQWHGGKLEAVYNLKDWSHRNDHGEYVDGIGVQDVERGALKGIKAQPWQTDTCIGNWYYRTGQQYKPVGMVVAMLADIVSKNGNLLLNIPLKHDGTIDAEEEKFLAGFSKWIAVNAEAIYGTRPWTTFGEGPHKTTSGHFNERQFARMAPEDIRFTTRDGALYAIALGWPEDGELTLRSLARPAGKEINRITDVALLGHTGKIPFTQSDQGLTVTLPARKPCEHAIVLRIKGERLQAVPVVHAIRPAKDGRVVLRAAEAEIHGATPKYEKGGGKDHIGYWASAKDSVSWTFQLRKAGTYEVRVAYSCATGRDGSRFTVSVGKESVEGLSKPTGSWAKYHTEKLGTVKLAAGSLTLTVKPKTPPAWKVIGLQSVTLVPAK